MDVSLARTPIHTPLPYPRFDVCLKKIPSPYLYPTEVIRPKLHPALQGSWRLRREDVVKNDFCMVLMDRGVYDGGFNIHVAKAHPSAPAVQE